MQQMTFNEQRLLTKYDNLKALSEIDKVKLIHGWRVLITDLKKFLLLYALSIILGVSWQMIIVNISFLYIRQVAFGFHCSTFKSCLAMSVLLFPVLTYIVDNIQILKLNSLLVFLASIAILLVLAPLDSVKTKVQNKKHKVFLKRKMYKRLIIVSFLILILPNFISLWIVWGLAIEAAIILVTYIKK